MSTIAVRSSTFLAALTGVLLSAASAQAPVVETTAIHPTTGHLYIELSPSNWFEAEAQAVALGGHLVTVNSQSEWNWIRSTFQTCGRPLWIGLTDSANEGSFKWVSGEPVSFTAWKLNEPNDFGGNEDHAVQDWGGAWYDLNGAQTETGEFPCQAKPIRGLVEITGNTMAATPESLSVAQGGQQVWSLSADPGFAGSIYLALGRLTPDGVLFVGDVPLPITLDAYFDLTLEGAGGPLFPNSLGVLDGAATANASLQLPPGLSPSLAGLKLYHCFVVLDPVTGQVQAASNQTSLELVP